MVVVVVIIIVGVVIGVAPAARRQLLGSLPAPSLLSSSFQSLPEGDQQLQWQR
jgi:hypothetical protein